MNVSFDGFNENVLTFNSQGAVCSAALVKMADNATVSPCADNDKFIGVVRNTSDGLAGVQVGGYVTCSYTGTTAPTVGFCNLAAGGANVVKVSSTGMPYLVVDVDASSKTVGLIL